MMKFITKTGGIVACLLSLPAATLEIDGVKVCRWSDTVSVSFTPSLSENLCKLPPGVLTLKFPDGELKLIAGLPKLWK